MTREQTHDSYCRCRQDSLNYKSGRLFTLTVEGSGRCTSLEENAPIPTPDGWIALKNITPGQIVFDEGGRPCSVSGIFHRRKVPVYRVVFDDGSCILAGTRHPWKT